MTCPHRDGFHCAVSATLAGLDRVTTVTDAACNYCQTRATPHQSRNKVTCDLAIAALRLAGRHADAVALMRASPDLYEPAAPIGDRLRAVESGRGVGSQIWRLLGDLGVHHDPNCDCLSWAERLNDWGPAGCRLARAEIVEHLALARKQLGWARSIVAAARAATDVAGELVAGRRPWLNPLDPYGSLVDEAIRLAESHHDVPTLSEKA